MRQAVLDGTLTDQFENVNISVAGKTGTAEYCDQWAQAQNRCTYGNWPTHAWTVGYAPFENPEIAIVAFVYNGGEGSSVAGPIIRRVMEAYFELKAIDKSVRDIVADSAEFAQTDPEPDPSELYTDILL